VHHEVHGPQAEVKDAELVNYPSLTRKDNGYPVFFLKIILRIQISPQACYLSTTFTPLCGAYNVFKVEEWLVLKSPGRPLIHCLLNLPIRPPVSRIVPSIGTL
jgi:hypothetical protein